MSVYDAFEVVLYGVDGSRWDVHGPLAGRQGVWIGQGQLSGLLDAPYESAWAASAAGGARHVRDVFKPRDFVLGFHVNGEGESFPGQREAALAAALSAPPYRPSPTKRTARIEVTTDLSGTRMVRVRGREVPDIDTDRDILADAYANPIYQLRAGQPLWESDTKVEAFEGTGSSASGTVTVSNPSDTPSHYTVVLTPATWVLPDPSWLGEIGEAAPGGEHADRTVTFKVTAQHEGAVVSRDRTRLLVATPSGKNLLAEQEGHFLRFDLPAWLPPTELPISYTAAPAGGARAEYHLPRRWTRPWGMEAPA